MEQCILRRYIGTRFPFFVFLSCMMVIFIIMLSPSNAFSVDITLAWDFPDEAKDQISGYKVFYRREGEEYNYNEQYEQVEDPNIQTCTIYNLDNTIYYFVARATDDSDNQNPNSNEVRYTPEINDPPVAEANGPCSISEGQAVSFSSAGSGDGNKDPVTYSWDFGNGQTSTQANPSHSYVQDGTYTVTLTVSDGSLTDTDTATVTVGDTEPVADFSGTPTVGSAPLTVNFTASATSYDGISSYSWSFGDGGTGTGASLSHTYTGSGTYTVSVSVEEADGDTATEARVGYITVGNDPPVDTPILIGLSISGENAVDENSLSHYIATAEFSDGNTQIVTDLVTWSEDSLFADINSNGELSNSDISSDKMVTITATYNFNDIIETAEMTVTIVDVSDETLLPFSPVITSPYDGETECDLMLHISTLPFSDPNGNIHIQTRWQISKNEDFSTLVLDITSNEHLTEVTVPALILDAETTYYVRVRFFDGNFVPTYWSDINEFTTTFDINDTDYDGIPDDQEVIIDSDLNGDGIVDNNQPDIIRSIQSVSDSTIIATLKDTDSIVAIEAINATNPSTMLEEIKAPKKIMLDLFSYRLRLNEPGATVMMKIYFSRNISMAKYFYKYDTIHGWEDYTQYVNFDYKNQLIIVELQDDGHRDTDGVANGIIVDPGMLVEEKNASASSFDNANKGVGCFIGIIDSGL